MRVRISEENKVLRDKAIKLRKKGYTLNEILKEIPKPRGTVAHWIRGLVLTEEQKETIKAKEKNRQRLNQAIATKEMSRKYELIRNQSFKDGQDYINSFTIIPNDIVTCVSLYWAEGGKTSSFGLSNSDPDIIVLFEQFMRNRMNIPKEKIKVALNFYDNHKTKQEVESYWQKMLDVPYQNFYKSQINNKPQEKAGTKYGKLPYGVCWVGTSSIYDRIKILGMIDTLKRRMLKSI